MFLLNYFSSEQPAKQKGKDLKKKLNLDPEPEFKTSSINISANSYGSFHLESDSATRLLAGGFRADPVGSLVMIESYPYPTIDPIRWYFKAKNVSNASATLHGYVIQTFDDQELFNARVYSSATSGTGGLVQHKEVNTNFVLCSGGFRLTVESGEPEHGIVSSYPSDREWIASASPLTSSPPTCTLTTYSIGIQYSAKTSSSTLYAKCDQTSTSGTPVTSISAPSGKFFSSGGGQVICDTFRPHFLSVCYPSSSDCSSWEVKSHEEGGTYPGTVTAYGNVVTVHP